MITHTTFLSLNHSTLKSALESPFQKEALSHQLQWLLPKHHHSNNWSVMQKWTCWFVNQRLNKSLVSRWHLYTMMYKLPCKSQAMFTQLQSTVNIRLNGHTVRLQAQHYYWSHSLKNVGLTQLNLFKYFSSCDRKSWFEHWRGSSVTVYAYMYSMYN